MSVQYKETTRWVGSTIVFAALLAAVPFDSRADYCTEPMSINGPRQCDYIDTDTGTNIVCPEIDPESNNIVDTWAADFNTFVETTGYLSELDDSVDGEPDNYLEIIHLGPAQGLDFTLHSAPIDVDPLGMLGALRVARITEDADLYDEFKPATLYVCSVHAEEWIAHETCLGVADYLVKAAHGWEPYTDPADGDEVRELLAEREIWLVVSANPAGRLRQDIGTDNGRNRYGLYPHQRKNRQWSPSLECTTDWPEQDGAGRSFYDVRWVSEPRPGNWDQPGINLDANFSANWGDGSNYSFTRDVIHEEPGQYPILAPEQFDCEGDSSKCEEEYGENSVYDMCVEYTKNGDNVHGCFVSDGFADLDLCNIFLDNPFFLTGEFIPASLACLETDMPVGPNQYLVWECGTPGAFVEDIENPEGNPVYEANPGNPNLLQFCHWGILQSCWNDWHCRPGGVVVNADDYEVEIPWEEDPFNNYFPPHLMAPELMNQQLYCAIDEHPILRRHACTVDGRRSCGAATFGGRWPFEAIEARLIRELINNIPFSIVVDAHSSAAVMNYVCTVSPSGDGCEDVDDYSWTNGAAMAGEAAAVNNDAGKQHFDAVYLGDFEHSTEDTSFPDFLRLTSGAFDPDSGRPPVWSAQVVEAAGDPDTSVWVYPATSQNFDLGTVRAIPSFEWELGARDPDELSEHEEAFFAQVTNCSEERVTGSKPMSRLMVENQLASAREVVKYLAGQAEIPNVGRTRAGSPFDPLRRDVALLGLRIHDTRGRGVQQSETRWEEIDNDPHAEIVVPAGTWMVSFDHIAGTGGSVVPMTAELNLTVTKVEDDPLAITPYNPVQVLLDAQTVDLDLNTRDTVTRAAKFDAGWTYMVRAWNSQLTPNNDTTANDELIAKVKVLDCADDPLPNDLSPDEFCRKGLPFDDDDFTCWEAKGICQECWFGDSPQLCEGEYDFCVNGMCDDPGVCWSGQIEDAWEAPSDDITDEGVPEYWGPFTSAFGRTLRKLDQYGQVVQDEDRALFYSTPDDPGGMFQRLVVRVFNKCAGGSLVFEYMTELQVKVEQVIGVFSWSLSTRRCSTGPIPTAKKGWRSS
jgi:hypothetical protein